MASPFLPAGAALGDSGGELSSGDESGDAEGLGNPEMGASGNLAELFEKAAAHLQGLVQVASREQLLYLYARYKQVSVRGMGRRSPGTGLCFAPELSYSGAWSLCCETWLQGCVVSGRVQRSGCGLGCGGCVCVGTR